MRMAYSLTAGALALASPGNGTATATLAFATSAAYTGVDVYTKNFLFGSNNIEAARALAPPGAIPASRHVTVMIPAGR